MSRAFEIWLFQPSPDKKKLLNEENKHVARDKYLGLRNHGSGEFSSCWEYNDDCEFSSNKMMFTLVIFFSCSSKDMSDIFKITSVCVQSGYMMIREKKEKSNSSREGDEMMIMHHRREKEEIWRCLGSVGKRKMMR